MDKGLIVEWGTLLDVIGRPRTSKNFIFMGALFEVGESLTPLSAHQPPNPNTWLDPKATWEFPWYWPSLWVRSRIPRVFGFNQPLCVNNQQPMVTSGFVAFRRDTSTERTTAYLFICTESTVTWYEEEPLIGLQFLVDVPKSAIQKELAYEFWSLLTRDPGDLEPFSDYTYDDEGYNLVGFESNNFFRLEHGAEDRSVTSMTSLTPNYHFSLRSWDAAPIAMELGSRIGFHSPMIVRHATETAQ